jgi:hypothetical protein
VLKSWSRILSGQSEPHPFSAARATSFNCRSGAKPNFQNRTIKKKRVLRSRIKNPGKNLYAAPEPQEPHRNFNPKKSRSREPRKHDAAAVPTIFAILKHVFLC